MATKGFRTVTLVNAKQKGAHKKLPVDPVLNNGLGVQHYLAKRDPESGKPIYYMPEAWASMGEAAQKVAMDFSPIESDAHRSLASNITNAFLNADPLARKAIAELVAKELASGASGASGASSQQPASGQKAGRS